MDARNSVQLNIQQQLLNTSDIRALVEQFLNYSLESRGHSKWTVRTRKTHLKQFTEFCARVGVISFNTLNHQIIDQYFVEYTQTHSKNTANAGRRILKVFLRWVHSYKEMAMTVMPEAIMLVRIADRLPKSIDPEVIRKVIQDVKNKQDALMIALMTEGGLRIGELAALQAHDIKNDMVHIRGKGEIDRMVFITDHLAEQLASFIAGEKRQLEDFLFQNDVYRSYGPKLSIGTARNRIQRCFKKVADMDMYPHQLRHTFAINLLQAGCDIVTIQNLMGHKDVTTTQVYLRVSNNYVKTEYKKYIGESFLA